MGTTDELRSETSFNFCNCFIFVNWRKKTEAWKLDVEAIRWRWLDSFMWCRSLRYAHVNSTDSRWHFLSGDGLLETRMYSISPKLGFGNMALHKYTHTHWRNAFWIFSFISRCDLGGKKIACTTLPSFSKLLAWGYFYTVFAQGVDTGQCVSVLK